MTHGLVNQVPVILVRSWSSRLEVYSKSEGRTFFCQPQEFQRTHTTTPSVQPLALRLADRTGPWLENLRALRETLAVKHGPSKSPKTKSAAKPRASKAKSKPDPMALLMAKFGLGAVK